MPNISMHTEGQASSFTCESHADFISQHLWNSASQMCPKSTNCEPLLFLIYINDLPLYIQEVKLILYADDTNVLITDYSQEALQTKLFLIMKQLETWFLNNDLIINITKTKAMSFHLCNSKPTYKPHILLHNKDIEYKSEVKFLGLCITENLNWQPHICYLCNNLRKSFFVIKSVKNIFSNHVIWNIYFASFHAQIRYGIILWGGGRKRKSIKNSKKFYQINYRSKKTGIM